jgi:hypothetical protein
MTEARFTPVSVAILGALTFIAAVVFLGAAIGGAYFLSIRTSHEQQVAVALQSHRELVSQEHEGQLFEAKLCGTLDKLLPLAHLKAPAGNPRKNPSRRYEQQLNHVLEPLADLPADLKCAKA